MTQSRELALLAAVREALAAELMDIEAVVQARMMPHIESEELSTLHVVCYWDGGERSIVGRGIDERSITIGIALQQAVPHASQNDRGETVFDGVDSLPFADQMFALADRLQSLWEADGSLRNVQLAGCTYAEMDTGNLYEPADLLTKGVLSIVFAVTYSYHRHDTEDDE